MPTYDFLTYRVIGDGMIVRITLNRPKSRNAQNRGLLVELDHAFLRAEANDDVRVIILSGAGSMFSTGHDLGSTEAKAEKSNGRGAHPSYAERGGTRQGAEQRMLQEWHYYFNNTRRWRDLRKITIAEVHGSVYAAGLMLAWACDLIVAAEGTVFADVVGTRLGMCGMEFFGHPWEFGPRKAKELLLTGDSIDADECYRLGMVSKVFAADRLGEYTEELARRIAAVPTIAALLIKDSVNQSVDNMGFNNALNACFSLHQLNHAHWAEITNGERSYGTVEDGLVDWRTAGSVGPAQRDLPGLIAQTGTI